MANQKEGLDYYNVDTNRYNHRLIKRLKRRYKAAGVGIYDYVLAQIYGWKGCYVLCDEDFIGDVSDYFNEEETFVSEVLKYCVEIDLFNARIFNEKLILTSDSIQSRYSIICKNAKRKNTQPPEFIRITPEESGIAPEELLEMEANYALLDGSFEQRKKEKKEKKGKESDELDFSPVNTALLIPEMLHRFKQKNKNFPADPKRDFMPLGKIAEFINEQIKLNGPAHQNKVTIVEEWDAIIDVILADGFYKTKSLSVISNQFQEIYQIHKHGKPAATKKAGETGGGSKFTDGANHLLEKGRKLYAAAARGENNSA